MNKIYTSVKVLSISGALLIAMIPATSVLAVSQSANTTSQSGQAVQSSQPTQAQESAKGKLDEAKKQICEKSEARIQNMFSNINKRSQAQINVMNKISEKVQAFYKNKNLEVKNYEQLMAEVTRTQTAAQAAVQAQIQTASQFGCDKDDPKGTANQYKVQVKAHIATMKEYKVAINNLIVAVKSANSTNANQGGQQ